MRQKQSLTKSRLSKLRDPPPPHSLSISKKIRKTKESAKASQITRTHIFSPWGLNKHSANSSVLHTHSPLSPRRQKERHIGAITSESPDPPPPFLPPAQPLLTNPCPDTSGEGELKALFVSTLGSNMAARSFQWICSPSAYDDKVFTHRACTLHSMLL